MQQPLWQRIPWWELGIELLLLLALPLISAVLAAIGRLPLVYVWLVAIGTLAMVMFAIANFESWRRPFRRRRPSPKETIDSIDGWLRENGYGRKPVIIAGASHAIEVQAVAARVTIAVHETKNLLVFMTSRGDSESALTAIKPDAEREKLKRDIEMEVVRMGAVYSMTEIPYYTITIQDSLPIDETLNEATVLQRVLFMERVDHLINKLYERAAVTLPPTRLVTPSISDTADSPPQ